MNFNRGGMELSLQVLSSRRRHGLLLVAVGATFTQAARADVINTSWLGGNGSWNDPTKWSGGVVPNNSAEHQFNVSLASVPW